MKNNRLWSLFVICAGSAAILGAVLLTGENRRQGTESTALVAISERPASPQNNNTNDAATDIGAIESKITALNGAHVPVLATEAPVNKTKSLAKQNPISTPHNEAQVQQPLPEKELAALMQRKLSPAMRREINQHLRPDNQPPRVVQSDDGVYVDLSDRASSVMIAIIDENDNTVIADITQPITSE